MVGLRPIIRIVVRLVIGRFGFVLIKRSSGLQYIFGERFVLLSNNETV